MADWMKRTIRSSRPEDRLPGPLRDVMGDSIERARNEAARKLADTSRTLRRIDALLDLFQPFTHDHDWVFEARGVSALTKALPDDEQHLFGFDIDSLCWRTYWVDIEYPGLSTWCFPLIDGGTVPEDPPHEPPVQWADMAQTLSRIA